MAARSKIWEHFIKITEKGVVVKGKCKYCSAEIKAHPVLNGTSGMHKHFGICRRNPHRCSDDASQVFCKLLKEIVYPLGSLILSCLGLPLLK